MYVFALADPLPCTGIEDEVNHWVLTFVLLGSWGIHRGRITH